MSVLSIEDVLKVINGALLSSEFQNAGSLTEPLTIEHIELDFKEMQMDSFMFICIIVALEEAFGMEIPDEYLIFEKLNCVKAFYDLLLELKQSSQSESNNECDDELKNIQTGGFDEQ